MHYYSTNKQSPSVNFQQAALAGQAPDKGLYFPQTIPQLPQEFLKQLKQKTKSEIAFEVIKNYVSNTIPEDVLFKICEETVNFDFPLIKITDDIYSMELFHGPTLSFKDVGARFMSRCLSHFANRINKKIVVLVATSGDTGSAVAHGFLNRPGVEVVILYPSGKVSRVQELQLTTLGNNIKALEIQGDFDDCQRMVKQAFADDQINENIFLTSANSINVARWLPQQFYYFFAVQQWQHNEAPVVAVPSGNFGNICSGMLAKTSGLDIQHFIAACNSNDVVTRYLNDGLYSPLPTVATISNAMDVGQPSNFVRLQELYKQDFNALKNSLSSYKVSDALTEETVLTTWKNHEYLADPHTAVGINALQTHQKTHPRKKGIVMSTAHPLKFSELMKKITGTEIEKTQQINELEQLKKQSVIMEADYESLKEYLKKI